MSYCAAKTRKGTPCKNGGTQVIRIGGTKALVCGQHHQQFKAEGGIKLVMSRTTVFRDPATAEAPTQQKLEIKEKRKMKQIKCGHCGGRHTIPEIRQCAMGADVVQDDDKDSCADEMLPTKGEQRVVTVTCKRWVDDRSVTHKWQGTISEVKGHITCPEHRS